MCEQFFTLRGRSTDAQGLLAALLVVIAVFILNDAITGMSGRWIIRAVSGLSVGGGYAYAASRTHLLPWQRRLVIVGIALAASLLAITILDLVQDASPPRRPGPLAARVRGVETERMRAASRPTAQRPIHLTVSARQQIRRRLGDKEGSAFDQDPFPEKPKVMHWRTYNRLAERYARYDAQWGLEVMRRFGTKL